MNESSDTCAASTVVALFEAHAAAAPNAIAVDFEGRSLTYHELDARAAVVARRLGALGVRRGEVVGLFVDRSPELVVGVLGVLKAGAAYLPLDPACPGPRLLFTLTDAGANMLLTERRLVDRLADYRGQRVLLEDLGDGGDDGGRVAPSAARLDDPAYVIYTSGSTGTPKGVMISHRNLARLFTATDRWFRFGASDVWTLFHSIAFDFSVWELWGALAYGGRLVVVPYAVSRSPQDFYRLLCDRRVTVLNQTPSAFRQLQRAEEVVGGGRELALRYVIFGGEALELQSLRPWFDRHGDQTPQLVNMYGITETTVHVTYRPLTRGDLATAQAGSPIGVPIPDLTVHVLRDDLSPAAPGETGEMYVGGAGVAAGYLNRPELTAARFIADSFAAGPSARLYRSGDLARVLADGQLEFLGRADGQVKIRGFRIEVGEIEALLAKQPTVAETAVVVREDAPGDRRLVAYVSPRIGATIDGTALRERLRERLPDYMIPAAIVVLDALPLTTNGKLDREALPVPEQRNGKAAEPVGELERKLTAIVARSLHGAVGPDDNFFDLGATSLHMADIHAELTKAHGETPFLLLFEHPTVRSLARQLAGTGNGSVAPSAAVERAQRQRAALGRWRPSP